jgi:hypothetical protein
MGAVRSVRTGLFATILCVPSACSGSSDRESAMTTDESAPATLTSEPADQAAIDEFCKEVSLVVEYASDPEEFHRKLRAVNVSQLSADVAAVYVSATQASQESFRNSGKPEGGYDWSNDIIVSYVNLQCDANLETTGFVAQP